MKDPMKKAAWAAILLGGMVSLTGCVAAAIGAGYVAGEELTEDDGDFDPLDEIDGEDED
ncbi:MAG: hypothetical protein MRY64_11095 [Hyphomonadaceae bacterium]|nr:hypothetical protein [Hyphomonadaceae bacterium]